MEKRHTRTQHRSGQSNLRKGRCDISGQVYMVTTVTHNRQTLFTDLQNARLVIRTLDFSASQDRSVWLAWVLMPDHFHGLIQLGKNDSLALIVGEFKGRSAHHLNAKRKMTGKVWQKSFFDRALRKEEDIKTAARYLIANPLRAGLVNDIGQYPHWDAVWL